MSVNYDELESRVRKVFPDATEPVDLRAALPEVPPEVLRTVRVRLFDAGYGFTDIPANESYPGHSHSVPLAQAIRELPHIRLASAVAETIKQRLRAHIEALPPFHSADAASLELPLTEELARACATTDELVNSAMMDLVAEGCVLSIESADRNRWTVAQNAPRRAPHEDEELRGLDPIVYLLAGWQEAGDPRWPGIERQIDVNPDGLEGELRAALRRASRVDVVDERAEPDPVAPESATAEASAVPPPVQIPKIAPARARAILAQAHRLGIITRTGRSAYRFPGPDSVPQLAHGTFRTGTYQRLADLLRAGADLSPATVAEALEKAIREGDYPPGRLMPTVNHLQVRLVQRGFSPAPDSNILADALAILVDHGSVVKGAQGGRRVGNLAKVQPYSPQGQTPGTKPS